ncbi:hypothetical protein PILCRDRAFT_813947 [Piloderma croceum F 1598]|uniref:Uncharacterized protein n=1 Tax=Piloderma croceum (strain F 1598) TaxID=765440 RepID=A0A0C3CGQ6_PILCF|nr:hypothetical protein PILCRDRAFT_813947 [Piloderma croceum F 1598]
MFRVDKPSSFLRDCRGGSHLPVEDLGSSASCCLGSNPRQKQNQTHRMLSRTGKTQPPRERKVT